MQTEFTFRHLDPSEALKSYATDKLSRLQKYLRAPLEAHVTLSIERHLQCVDMSISAGSEHYQGRAEQEDMYASIDAVVAKIQKQINRAKGHQNNHRRGPQPEDGPGE
jgi:putative sigma-54 modulation protein